MNREERIEKARRMAAERAPLRDSRPDSLDATLTAHASAQPVSHNKTPNGF